MSSLSQVSVKPELKYRLSRVRARLKQVDC
jgi:hypothetical protein